MTPRSRRHRQAQEARPKFFPSYLGEPDAGSGCDQRYMLTDTPDIHTVTCGELAAGTLALTCPTCSIVATGQICGRHPAAVWLCIACWYERDTFAEMTALLDLGTVPVTAESDWPHDLLDLLDVTA